MSPGWAGVWDRLQYKLAVDQGKSWGVCRPEWHQQGAKGKGGGSGTIWETVAMWCSPTQHSGRSCFPQLHETIRAPGEGGAFRPIWGDRICLLASFTISVPDTNALMAE